MPMLADLIRPLFAALGLSPQAGALVVAGLLLAAWPMLARGRRVERARRHLKEALRTSGADRSAREDQALAEVAGYPDGLLALAEEADRVGRFPFRDRVMAELRATGKLGRQLRALELRVEGPMPGSPAEAAVIVRALWSEGLDAVAEDRLARFRTKWPADTELSTLSKADQLTSPAAGAPTG